MKLDVSQITIDPTVDVRRKLDEETIQEYMDNFAELPPVTVFDTDGELILADGFHRVIAAQRLGISEIEAEVKKGGRDDVLEFAAYANTRHGKRLTSDERREGIRRLRLLHPDWGYGRVAELMACSEVTVGDFLRADEVRKGVGRPTPLSDSHLEEIGTLDRGLWPDIVRATEKRGWTRDEVRQAAKELKDETTPIERKKELLEGKTEPITRIQGEPAIMPDTIRRFVAEEKEKSYTTNFENALFQLANLRRFTAKEIVDGLDVERLQKLVKELPAYIKFEEEMLALAKQRLEIWR
jgi:ParB-like chromosome segregation protein Spo0J